MAQDSHASHAFSLSKVTFANEMQAIALCVPVIFYNISALTEISIQNNNNNNNNNKQERFHMILKKLGTSVAKFVDSNST